MIKPKKSLGQNFLKSKATASKIVACLNPSANDIIVEIGPGTGVLTEALIASQAEIYAVDIDSRMTSFLEQKYQHVRELHVINKDIMEFDFKEIAKDVKLKVIGNLPYHLTSPIIEKLCENHSWIETAVITIQKELAVRMTSEVGDSDYSSLTIFTDNFCRKECLFNLSPREFHPPPKVASTVIKLNFLRNPIISYDKYSKLREMIRLFFQQRRKMAVNSFVKFTDLSKEEAEKLFGEVKIPTKIRPQGISLSQYIRLFELWREHEA